MSLSSVLVLGGPELTGSSCLLLELLLLLRVGIADLDRVLLAAGLDLVIVEFSDDFFTNSSRLETACCVSND